jgi:hypothetical protein
MRLGGWGHIASIAETWNTHKISAGKLEWTRSFGRCRFMHKENIILDLKEIGYGDAH